MRYGFLLSMVGTGVVVTAGACGGKVVFEGNGAGAGGNGGHGGTSNVQVSSNDATTGVVIGPSTSVGPSVVSVGVGPSCTCGAFCGTITQCGGPGPGQCMGLCSQLPQSAIDCVCKAGPNCAEVKNCFGGGPGSGPGPGPSTSVGAGGGPPSQACADCVNMSAQATCQGPVSTCLNDPACASMIMCHQQCGWDAACKQQCDVGPAGLASFDTLMQCLLCKDCGMLCAGSEIFNEYCAFPL
jgi:hypothetical protein